MSRIVGIDLGTSTSEISYLLEGKPVLIPNHLGEFITPSIINISADGKIIIGSEAKEKLLIEPENTFQEVKRLMGSNVKLVAHDKSYSPAQLNSFLLRYLIDCANKHLNETITRAVITVPAYFSDEQRRETIEVGKLCGLNVERIINEPTAAALSYGLEHLEACTNILVYDLGGGTLDVTALEMFEGVMEVRASSGNNKLGGKDFDEAIIEYIVNKFINNHQSYIKNDLRAMAILKKEAELCKIALSTEESYNISLAFFTTIKGKPVSLNETITRKTFESLIKDKIDGTEEQIKVALQDAKMKIDEIDLILLVGGSTRIPYVENFIHRIFHKNPQRLVDPDLAVVQGAAIQAGIMDNKFLENEIVLTDVCPYTLGTSALKSSFYNFGLDEIEFDPIIKRNITIPTTVEKIYQTSYDRQAKVIVKVYQGEFSDPEKNNFLNSFELEGIPLAMAGQEKIAIAFSYDVNGILQVDASIVSTGKKASITISTADKEMIHEIDVSDWKKSKNAKKFTATLNKAEKILAVNEDDMQLKDLIRLTKEAIVAEKDLDEINIIKQELVDYILDLENIND